MPWKIKAKVDGLQEITRVLEELDGKLRKKVLRKAVSAAGSLMLKRAKQLAPAETKLLRKSLGRKVKVYSSGVAVAIVGPRKGYRQQILRKKGKWRAAPPPPSGYADPTKYGHLVELGTQPHTLKKRGISHPGSPAVGFLRNAVQGQQQVIREAVANVVKSELGV